jgi:hypothetical protein
MTIDRSRCLGLSVAAALGAGLAVSPAAASAQNLVVNGDFSSGFTEWRHEGFTWNPSGYVESNPLVVNGLGQLVAVAPGAAYTLEFDYQGFDLNFVVGSRARALLGDVLFDEMELDGAANHFSQDFVWPSAANTDYVPELVFEVYGKFGSVRLDNVSITPLSAGGGVPEPATWVTMIAGFCLVGFALRRPREVKIGFA